MKLQKFLLLAALLLVFQTTARADVALQFGNYSLRVDGQTTFGWAFTITAPISITNLGYFDFQGDGLTDSHPIAIWAGTGGSPLAMATVPAGTSATLLDGVRYVPITPIILPAGTYVIGGFSMNLTDSVAIESAILTTAPGISYAGARSAQGSSLTFPAGNTQGYSNGDFGPNFQFVAVPEPSIAALVLVGGAVFVGLRARKTR